MRATRDWLPPVSYACPGCGKPKPTMGWHDECDREDLDGQLSIYDELGPK